MSLREYFDYKDLLKEERTERRREREAYQDHVNNYYFGYANVPTCKEARHIYYMQNRDNILAYLKIWRKWNPEYHKIWIKYHPEYMKIWYQNHPNYDRLRYLRKKIFDMDRLKEKMFQN